VSRSTSVSVSRGSPCLASPRTVSVAASCARCAPAPALSAAQDRLARDRLQGELAGRHLVLGRPADHRVVLYYLLTVLRALVYEGRSFWVVLVGGFVLCGVLGVLVVPSYHLTSAARWCIRSLCPLSMWGCGRNKVGFGSVFRGRHQLVLTGTLGEGPGRY
jgi:hypothetical protein